MKYPGTRKEAANRLLALCPRAFRATMRPMLEMALVSASDEQVASLLADIDVLQERAEAGDAAGISELAQKYGATPAMLETYLPMILGSKAPA